MNEEDVWNVSLTVLRYVDGLNNTTAEHTNGFKFGPRYLFREADNGSDREKAEQK